MPAGAAILGRSLKILGALNKRTILRGAVKIAATTAENHAIWVHPALALSFLNQIALQRCDVNPFARFLG